MNPDFVENHELLYRAIHPALLGDPPNVFTSAAFKQIRPTEGVSVDRDALREPHAIVEFLKSHVNCGRVVRISAENCRQCQTNPIPSPLDNNPYHAEIYHENHPTQRISDGIKKRLIRLAEPIDL